MNGGASGAGSWRRSRSHSVCPDIKKLVRGKNWGDFDADDKKLTVATTRIHCLTSDGLTLEMTGADFIRRQIAPMHNKWRPAWDFRNAADIRGSAPA